VFEVPPGRQMGDRRRAVGHHRVGRQRAPSGRRSTRPGRSSRPSSTDIVDSTARLRRSVTPRGATFSRPATMTPRAAERLSRARGEDDRRRDPCRFDGRPRRSAAPP
jgi:hypothetical protein